MVKFAKRPHARKTYRKKKTARKSALTKAVKKVVYKTRPKREERFFVNKDFSTDTIANAFDTQVISNIAQGDQFNQRDGKRIYVSGVRLTFASQSNSTVKAKYLRLMVLRNKNSAGGTLDTTGFTNLLRNENFVDWPAQNHSLDITYPLNTNLLQIYFDKVYKILPEAEGNLYINRYVPIKRVLHYEGLGSGNVPTNGELFVVAHLCDGDDVTTVTTIKARAMYRIHYKDA